MGDTTEAPTPMAEPAPAGDTPADSTPVAEQVVRAYKPNRSQRRKAQRMLRVGPPQKPAAKQNRAQKRIAFRLYSEDMVIANAFARHLASDPLTKHVSIGDVARMQLVAFMRSHITRADTAVAGDNTHTPDTVNEETQHESHHTTSGDTAGVDGTVPGSKDASTHALPDSPGNQDSSSRPE